MTYVSTVLADGAVALFELGEASGSAATDQTGNQNGVYTGSTITYGQTGIPGGAGATAVKFAGGYLNVADNAAQRYNDVFSFEFWLKLTTTGVAYGLGADIGGGRLFRLNTAGNFKLTKQAVADVATSTGAITDTTTFHHCVITKNGATTVCYLDGTAGTTAGTNETFTDNAAGHLIADDSSLPNLQGTLAMVAWYTTALTSTQVSNHYNLGAGIVAASSGWQPSFPPGSSWNAW